MATVTSNTMVGTPQPTKAMRRALAALAAAPQGRLPYAEFYRAMNATLRGRYRVMSRMGDLDFIESYGGETAMENGFQITPRGLMAIGKNEAAEAMIREAAR